MGLVQRGLIASARIVAMGCLSRQVMNKAAKLVGSWISYLGFLEDDQKRQDSRPKKLGILERLYT